MPDYSVHRLTGWEWCEEYRSRMGREAYDKYINDVCALLLSMKPGNFFSIEKSVKPENRDLFIKICCMIMQEGLNKLSPSLGTLEFSNDYSIIRKKT